jgi:SAM-dependent methyltransferase
MRPWFNNIDLNKRILEIGPLCWPNVKKEQAKNVFYADIRSTEDIKKFYKNHIDVSIDKIVDIDYVINGVSYYDCLKDVDKFDYIVATHVIEHLPQLILFFQDIPKILNPHGKICLSIPDKRYCFDHFRYQTSFAECYDNYIRGINNSPFRVLDYITSNTKNDSTYWWKNANNFEHLPKSKNIFDLGKKEYMRALNGEYIDIHFSVFTPESFLLLIYNMIFFNLFQFKCIEFYKTDINSNEFNCVLELEPNILIEDSIENENEKKNIINLLIENQNQECFMVMVENLRNDLQKSNNDLEMARNDLQKSNNDLEMARNDLQKSNNDLEMTKNDLQAIKLSKSWRITAPLRKMKTVYNKIYKEILNKLSW